MASDQSENPGGAIALEGEMTIDELAQYGRLPVSTVRMYQNKGLLPPPTKRGRVGYYNVDHRNRIDLIAHLQQRGFSLAAIKDALDSWSRGASLSGLLGVGEVVPELTRRPLRLSPAELAERFAGVELTQADIQRAAEIGVIQIDGADIVVSNPAFAAIGPEVARLGVPVAEILDEYEVLRDQVVAIAERFRNVFDRHVWTRFVDDGMPADSIAGLTTDVAKLSQLANGVVNAELNDRFSEFVEEYVEQAKIADDR